MPKISIITPVYADISQKVDWLDEMIQSVISQSVIDWELIIIDDKSPLPIALQNSYVDEPRIRWFQNVENSGPSMTRNTAVALAESDCILPVDADDPLAHENVLEDMYDAWIMDKSKIIYGNLQQYVINANNQFERKKVIKLGDYTFERAMHLGGLIPVTAMHSVECWQQIGGWKNELDNGLEDVEYWLNAGKHGFCGHKIETTTLVYRRHETSRAYVLKHGNQEKNIPVLYREMQNKIKDMHNDVYQGRFPVACCGKGSTTSAVQAQVATIQSASVGRITELKGYEEKDLLWVEYNGEKKGSFSIMVIGASNLPDNYGILGKGHKFQVHKSHKLFFEQRQRLGFRINVQDPRSTQPEEVTTSQPIAEPSVVEIRKPELSTIIRPDAVAARSGQFDIQPAPIIMDATIGENIKIETGYKKSLNDLNLSPSIQRTLTNAGYSIESLANESLANLIKLAGIGEIRASQIIRKAKELINKA